MMHGHTNLKYNMRSGILCYMLYVLALTDLMMV